MTNVIIQTLACTILLFAFNSPAAAQDSCLLQTCIDHCKDTNNYCKKTNKSLKVDLLQQCKLSYEEDMADCTANQLDDSANCELLCESDLKACLKQVQTTHKACKKIAKANRKVCKAAAKADAKADKNNCKQDNKSCRLACIETLPPLPTPRPTTQATPTPRPTPAALCYSTKAGLVSDIWGNSATLSVYNPCDHRTLRIDISVHPGNQSTIFLCGPRMDIVQDGTQYMWHDDFVWKDLNFNSICGDYLPSITEASRIINYGLPLKPDFVTPFTLYYDGLELVSFP